MSDLDYTLLNAIKQMAGENDAPIQKSIISETLSEDATDKEILDYIFVFVCERLKSVNLSYKGGYVLMSILPDIARQSHDIDFSISQYEQYALVKKVLRELGEALVSMGTVDSYEIKEEIAETRSGGIKFQRPIGKDNLGIDIGLHDLSYGIQKWSILGLESNRFMVERMLSDKISAIFSKKRFRRAKDLYDFYILVNSCNVDISKLTEFLRIRGVDWTKTPFNEVVAREYRKAYDALVVKSYKGTILKKPEFDVCLKELNYYVVKIRELF